MGIVYFCKTQITWLQNHQSMKMDGAQRIARFDFLHARPYNDDRTVVIISGHLSYTPPLQFDYIMPCVFPCFQHVLILKE